ncbi:MAG TPA: Phenylacetic acid catabolic protein [Thermoanaerobaculia bacterium]|jgi:1,2-phenylacetyl-CoA epoxidase catalytic subunit|nr:Phenylacetic acid catabolic protein [Thermoanaerobaculia bacterium]
MNVKTTTLPKQFHDAVLKWKDAYLPDYEFLLENWEKHFPREPQFELCAYRELGMCTEIECGDAKGKPKFTRAADMSPEQAHHLHGAIRAQASTEFGSIQQHRLTLARAQDEEEQFWILRMMAEELRHGYQMLHLLVEDDWTCVSKESASDAIEDILSMNTGSHLLGAFNIDFDSFVDNVVFCALIDRVGKYQLAMQKISAYQPMAESMPQMLREEAFHLASGVVPMRRWVMQAAKGEGLISMDMLQKALNKWLPRGLEMFGDERGGGTNVRYGLKPMKNAEAQRQYYDEVSKLVRDLNLRYLRARVPSFGPTEAETALDRILAGEAVEGMKREDLLHMPHPDFFRRRGVPAFKMAGVAGESFDDFQAYLRHLEANLPDAYRAGRDYKDFVDAMAQVARGETTAEQAAGRMPALRRVGGSCPCSKSVRWVVDEPALATPPSPIPSAVATA